MTKQKTTLTELIEDVGSMAQGMDADELFEYFMKKSKSLLQKEKDGMFEFYSKGIEDSYEYYKSPYETEKRLFDDYFNSNYQSIE